MDMKHYMPLCRDSLECKDLQVVILMGGMGKRLKENTRLIPKPLVDVHGKPFFEYEMELLLKAGFQRFLFLVGYKATMIEDYFGDGSRFRREYGSQISIDYCYDGEELRGTGGAVVNAINHLEYDFMLCYADSFMDVDYFEIIYRYYYEIQNGKKALMTVLENENLYDKSNVLYENGEIVKYDKKNLSSQMRYIDYGIEVFRRSIFENITNNAYLDLSEIQKSLVEEGLCGLCEVTQRFYEIGTPKSLNEFKNYVEKRYYHSHIACLLDRDGVINEIVFNEETEQLDSPMTIYEFIFKDGVVDALKTLSDKGIDIYVITNQPAAAKGKTTLGRLYDINKHMAKILKEQGVHLSGIQICPHHPQGDLMSKEKFLIKKCNCRKPNTGMIDFILKSSLIDKSRSYMIGDSYTDIMAGISAGLKTAFIGDYKCDVCAKLNYHKPNFICRNLNEAVDYIVKNI